MRNLKNVVVCMFSAVLVCLISGCNTIEIDPLGDMLRDHSDKRRMKDYQRNGLDENTARRRVYEENFFNDMKSR